MTKKLEDLFNLDHNADTSESMRDTIELEQDSKNDKEANELIQQKIGLDKIDNALPQVDGLGEDKEIDQLNIKLEDFRKTIEESNNLYESMLDKTTKSLEKILLNTESISKIQ